MRSTHRLYPPSSASATTYSVSLPARPATVGAVRELLRELPLLQQLAHEQRQTLLLLASEIIGNAVKHGSVEGDEIEVRVALDGAGVVVSALDAARAGPPMLLTPETEREGGRGLALLDRVADAWGERIDGGRREVWFALDVRPPDAHA
jgi:anti-sigma regulatory factor (Ser/Thr protein kinase)